MPINAMTPNVGRPSTAMKLIKTGHYAVNFYDDGFQFRGVNAE